VGDDSSNLWDINTSQMWNDGSGAAAFNDGDTVTLDDTGSDSPAINLTATVSPASVAVDNATRNYTIEGAGTLAGAMTLTKAGTGTLKLSTANTFSGVVTVSGGILDFAPPNTVTMNNIFLGVSNGGTFRKTGANKLTLSCGTQAGSRFAGPVVVDGGTLQFNTSTSYKYRGLCYAWSYTVNSGATLHLEGQGDLQKYAPMTLNGGTLSGAGTHLVGTLTMNGATVTAKRGLGGIYRALTLYGANVTVSGSVPSVMNSTFESYSGFHLAEKTAYLTKTFTVADVTGDTNADLTVSASFYNSYQSSAVCSLSKAGPGTMVMSAGNYYTGTTTVNAGTLLVSGSLDSPTVNVNDGGTLLVSSSSPLPKAMVTVAAGGTFGAEGTVATSVTNLTFAEDSNVSWTYDGDVQTAGLVTVTGTLTLPAAATVKLSGSGALRSDQVLFTAGTIAGSTDLSGWTVNNIPEGTFAGVQLIDNQVILKTFRGTVITIQ